MKPLPDVVTSASFWAAFATLWGAAGAWFTFVLTAKSSRKQTYEGVMNLIAGIEAELRVVENWASGKEGDEGYLKTDDASVLARKHPDWFNPSRHIYTFDSPTLNNFTNSPFVAHLMPLVPVLVRLSNSVHRLFDFVTTQYNPFVASDPRSYQGAVRNLSLGVPLKSLESNEQIYVNFVFGMNKTIHQDLIGGVDCTDDTCLYKAFRSARSAIGDFKKDLHVEPLPRWYWILNILAICLIVVGFVEVFRWFDLSRLF
ncbi:MAG TPA: hypothetical protein VKT50_05705 [Candidatus Acidoferrales bacterium]|nr:hypothetical protein [Candidatus Acidoferrales bacterium]